MYIADNGNTKIRLVTSTGIITTIAGTGDVGSNGDGGAATSALLNNPKGVSVDISGNMYIADFGNNKIRMVSSAGIITTIAGTGDGGSSGDGGAATSARLSGPSGVSVDISGNVYIADYSNGKIRLMTSTGIITTVAGTGTDGSSGDGGAATSAQLNGPYGVSVDIYGNVYITDTFNNKIRMVTSAGIITTVAGTGDVGFSGDGGAATSAQLDYPYGVTVDISGNVYIADYFNHRIRMVTNTGIIATFAGSGSSDGFFGLWSGGSTGDGGPATAALLYYPSGVSVDIVGNVYIADTDNHKIRIVTNAGIITLSHCPLPTTPLISVPSTSAPTHQPSSRPTSSPSIKAYSLAPIPVNQQQPSVSTSIVQVSTACLQTSLHSYSNHIFICHKMADIERRLRHGGCSKHRPLHPLLSTGCVRVSGTRDVGHNGGVLGGGRQCSTQFTGRYNHRTLHRDRRLQQPQCTADGPYTNCIDGRLPIYRFESKDGSIDYTSHTDVFDGRA